MKCSILSLLLLFSISVSAKKIPKWKGKHFKTASSGIRYDIKKTGDGYSVQTGDAVRFFCYGYNYKTKKYDRNLSPAGVMMNPKTGSLIQLDQEYPQVGFVMALRMLRAGGEGYFIIPGKLSSTTDSACYFIKVVETLVMTQIQSPPDTTRADTTVTLSFKIPDPESKNFGDTLFTTMQLVEVPMAVTCHGIAPTLQAVKFKVDYFDNGVKHKQYLIYIECPDGYGKNFFVPGSSYMIIAIPLMENHKKGHQVQNSYSMEKLDSYYCLRITKMN